MHKIYLILRNNKQNGPYTLEEVVQLNLKPHDLIWVEGRSAGWRYPTEIEALKPYVAGAAPDPSAQKTTQMPTEPAEAPIRTISTSDAVAVKQASKTSKHIYISLPGGNVAPAAPASQTEAGEESPEAKLERRARELQQRIQAFAQNQQEKPKEEPETKYARSLEDLRQDYANWLHKKKRKKGFAISKTQMMIAAAVVFVLVSGFTIARMVSGTAEEGKESVADIKLQPLTANAAFPEKTENDGFQNAATIEQPAPHPIVENEDPYALTPEEEAIVDNYLASLQKGLAEESKTGKNRGAAQTSRLKGGTKTNGQNDPGQKEQAASQQTHAAEPMQPAQQERKSVPLPELINLNGKYKYDDSKRHITGLEVTIQNNSDQMLKRVAVDVFYYKKKERLFEKETLYFNNIYPQNSLTLATAGNKKAVSARFQLGLVTTE